jgi:RimJ/RimL family protein N-acetyltransferase
VASGRVLQKIGMQREGVLRRHILKWGEFVDEVVYGILREEYVE